MRAAKERPRILRPNKSLQLSPIPQTSSLSPHTTRRRFEIVGLNFFLEEPLFLLLLCLLRTETVRGLSTPKSLRRPHNHRAMTMRILWMRLWRMWVTSYEPSLLFFFSLLLFFACPAQLILPDITKAEEAKVQGNKVCNMDLKRTLHALAAPLQV